MQTSAINSNNLNGIQLSVFNSVLNAAHNYIDYVFNETGYSSSKPASLPYDFAEDAADELTEVTADGRTYYWYISPDDGQVFIEEPETGEIIYMPEVTESLAGQVSFFDPDTVGEPKPEPEYEYHG